MLFVLLFYGGSCNSQARVQKIRDGFDPPPSVPRPKTAGPRPTRSKSPVRDRSKSPVKERKTLEEAPNSAPTLAPSPKAAPIALEKEEDTAPIDDGLIWDGSASEGIPKYDARSDPYTKKLELPIKKKKRRSVS